MGAASHHPPHCKYISALSSVSCGADKLQWSVENSADDIKKGGKDVHKDNPAEELNFHGLFNDSSNPLKGANYGYPSCFSTWDPSTLGNAVGSQTTIDASVGSVSDADCAKRTAPKLVFPAHTAPVDIKFKKDGSAAYITFHGSWYVHLFLLLLSELLLRTSTFA
jgi:hypothetical protein